MELTPQLRRKLAYAAGMDMANRRMRKDGRTRWTKEDYNAAVREYHRICSNPERKP